MTIEIWQALLIGCVAALTALEGDFLGECKLREPLVTGFLVGLILGDVRQGIIIGGQLQLIWMGATGIGLSAQLDIGCGGTIGTAIALMTNSGAEVAMAFGLPVSILMQSLNVLKMTGFSGIMHKVDRYAEEGNMKGMIRLHYFCGFITFLLYCVPTFVSVYMGSGLVQTVVDSLPQWAMDGLTAVSALLPAHSKLQVSAVRVNLFMDIRHQPVVQETKILAAVPSDDHMIRQRNPHHVTENNHVPRQVDVLF